MEILNRCMIDELCQHSKSLLVDTDVCVCYLPPDKKKSHIQLKYLQDNLSHHQCMAFLVLERVTGIDSGLLPPLATYHPMMTKNIEMMTVMTSNLAIRYSSKEQQQSDFEELSLKFSTFNEIVNIEFFLVVGRWITAEKDSKINFKIMHRKIT